MLVALCEMAGLLFLGHQLIHTLAREVIVLPAFAPPSVALLVPFGALIGALSWNIVIWRFALPSSSTHALLGAIAGAAFVQYGRNSVHWAMFTKMVLLLAFVPMAGILFAFLLARLLYWVGEFLTPAAGTWLRGLQIVAMAGTAMVHGSNGGQRAIGLVFLAALAMGQLTSLSEHFMLSLTLLSGAALGIGVIFGSQRTIDTVGRGLYRVQGLQGFCAASSTMVLVGASSLGGYPMSTSHVMSMSVLGAGVAVHPRDVRWTLVGEMMLAWVLTLPASALVAAFWTKVLGALSHVVS
jgi:PiT family inorganic phosphate transporter